MVRGLGEYWLGHGNRMAGTAGIVRRHMALARIGHRQRRPPLLADGEVERAMGLEPTTGCLGSSSSTTELRPHIGGASRDRTGDLLHAMQALSHLSYGPKRVIIRSSSECNTGSDPRMRVTCTFGMRRQIQRCLDGARGVYFGLPKG